MKLQAGQVIAERYRIDRVLGSGGMAVVYRALDTKLDRYVSLKTLREELAEDAEFIRRFPIEAMAAAALSHPNIVSIYDYGQDRDIYYIVLEYIDGSSLKDLINRHAPFDNDATLGMALQVADGLAAAHRAQIVHRDVKPQNIMVTNSSNAKVTDFGIARVAKSGTITTGESMGSAQYFSPEQARGGYVDHKTDIYSLGIVMYEMATGQLPFDGDNLVSVALKHINDPLPNMLEFNPGISDDVIRIILKATEKSPDRRYKNMAEMADDLNQALSESDESHAYVQPRHIEVDDYQDDETDDLYDDEYYDDDDDYDYEEPPIDKKADRMAILIGVGVGLLFTLLILLGSCSVYGRLRTVRLSPPDVIGMTLEEAENAARDARLTIAVQESVFHNEVEEGLIISQSHSPEYSNMSPGEAIRVTLSLGPSPYVMPDLLGMNIEDAMELLTELPVDYLHVEQEDETEPGTIFYQDPEAGSPVGEGTMVIIYISLGMEASQVLVPNLQGLTRDAAMELLEEASLIAGIILHEESITYATGLISWQDPRPGTVVDRETMVGFTISTGSPIPTPGPTPEPQEDDDPYEDDDEDPDEPDDDLPEYPGYEDDPDQPDPYYPEDDDPVDQPVPVVRNLVIDLWDVAEYVESVFVRVIRHHEGASTMVANTSRSVNDFPFEMQIQGNGLVIYRLYSVEGEDVHFVRAYEVNFDD